jgi:hypothetical protein
VNFYEIYHCRHHDCPYYFFTVGVRKLITDAQKIIDRAYTASVAQNLDDRSRLAYEVGMLHGHLREVCFYLKFMEDEIEATLKAFDRLKTE